MSKEHDLIRPGIPQPGGCWADIGSGTGIFTATLYEVLGEGAVIYSVERNQHTLEKQRRALSARYPHAQIHYRNADFTQPLDLPPLDGIVMANALHYVPLEHQEAALKHLCTYLKPGHGKFIIVEYESRRGNLWVPHPVNYASFEYLAGAAGLSDIRRLAAIPSSFLNEMYSAMGVRAE